MPANIDNRRAAFARQRIQGIRDANKAKDKNTAASETIALIRKSSLLKALTSIQTKKAYYENIHDDLAAWFAKAGMDDGPQLSTALQAYAADLPAYIEGHGGHALEQTDYMLLTRECLAFCGWIKLKAESKFRQLDAAQTTTP